MGRYEILKDVKNYKTEQEIVNHDWEKIAESSGPKTLTHRDRFGTIRYELFEHSFEKGLWADFRQNDDGTWTCVACWDELHRDG